MGVVTVNVYKHDNTFFTSPSLMEFAVDEIEGWQAKVEKMLADRNFTPRSKYFLAYRYQAKDAATEMMSATA